MHPDFPRVPCLVFMGACGWLRMCVCACSLPVSSYNNALVSDGFGFTSETAAPDEHKDTIDGTINDQNEEEPHGSSDSGSDFD